MWNKFFKHDSVKIIDSGDARRDFSGEYGVILSITGDGTHPAYEIELTCGEVEYFTEYQLEEQEQVFQCPNGCDPDTPACPDCYPHDTDLMRDIAREDERV